MAKSADRKQFERTVKECAKLRGPIAAADYFRWGVALFKLGRLAEASAVFKNALREHSTHPDRHEFLIFLGRVQQAAGEYAEAIESLEGAIALFKSPEAYAALGDSLREVGERKRAEQAYRAALSMALPGEEAAVQAEQGLRELRDA